MVMEDNDITPCTCDVCTLIGWLEENLDGASGHRAVLALTEALWRVIAQSEAEEQTQLHQTLIDMGLDPHTLMMLRTSVKLATWELSSAAELAQDPDAEPGPQTVLH
jgi:aryl carrier-like protein